MPRSPRAGGRDPCRVGKQGSAAPFLESGERNHNPSDDAASDAASRCFLMAALTILNEWLKDQFEQPGRIEAMSKRKTVALDKVSTRQDSGENFRQPALLHGGRAWADSRSAAQAISNDNESNLAPFDWVSYVGKIKGNLLILHDEIAATGNDRERMGAYAKTLQVKTDNMLQTFGTRINRGILGPKGMWLFRGTILNGVITLDSRDVKAISYIEARADQLQASTDDGSSSSHVLLGSGSVGYVTSLTGRFGNSPTVTVSTSFGGSAATPSGWTESTTIYFYFRGEFKGGIDTGAKFGHRIDSIQAWVTDTDATDTFKTVDRSRDPRMSGVKLASADVANDGVEEVFEHLFDIGRERADWSGEKEMYVSTARFRQLSRHLESRRMRTADGSRFTQSRKQGGDSRYASSGATFSYATITLNHQSGAYEIIDEVDMPNDYVLATSLSDWEIVHYDGFPHLIDDDGVDMLRKTTEDDYEMRWTTNASFKLKKDAMITDTGRAPFPVSL